MVHSTSACLSVGADEGGVVRTLAVVLWHYPLVDHSDRERHFPSFCRQVAAAGERKVFHLGHSNTVAPFRSDTLKVMQHIEHTLN